ncbi:MAG: hypothetical protein R3E09_01675 [Novosphingobium sp.]|nr:hypothetical protein [Novosphingobium sp.]
MFDWFYLSGRILSILPGAYEHLFTPGVNKGDSELSGAGLVIYYFFVFSPIIPPLLLWYFVSRKANNIARWLLLAFVVYEGLAVTTNWLFPAREMPESFWPLLVLMVISDLVAVTLLYRSDSRKWFKLRGRIDPQTFD